MQPQTAIAEPTKKKKNKKKYDSPSETRRIEVPAYHHAGDQGKDAPPFVQTFCSYGFRKK